MGHPIACPGEPRMKYALPVAMLALMTGSAIAAPVTYDVDPNHTYPGFEADHFGGLSLWCGKCDKSSGTIGFDQDNGSRSEAITIDAASNDFCQATLKAHAASPY